MAVQTSFDDAITALSTRYNDLGLKRIDRNRFLKRKTTTLHKRMTRKWNSARQRGCTVDSIEHDFSLNVRRRCNAKSTLIADAENAKLFFNNHRKCAPFVRMIERSYTSKYEDFFGTDPETCEVNLASAFGLHSTAVGRVQGDAIVFDGIKYGDHQRFMRATAASNPTSNDFSSPSFSCPTASNVVTGSTTLTRTTPENEDCLYLKITAPLSAFEDGAPPSKVITWIHGGSFSYGGMDATFEDPTPLVTEQEIIVVKMNYRLGAFGGWYFPVRARAHDDQPKSNFALLDQRLAMKWVSDNIGSFNGDADDITLAGVSAGAAAVAFHLTHEDSYDYFNNALLMSPTTTPYWSEEDAEQAYQKLAIDMECATEEDFLTAVHSGSLVRCLQNFSVDQFKTAMAEHGSIFKDISMQQNSRLAPVEFGFAPNFDDETLINDPLLAIKNSNFKSDLGFLNIEVTTNDANGVSDSFFADPARRFAIFGPFSTYIWNPEINPNVIVPYGLHFNQVDVVLENPITESARESFMREFPCERQFEEHGQYESELMTECKEPFDKFLNAYLFTCPIDNATRGTQLQNLYQVVFDASTPGPGPDSGSDFMQPYEAPFQKCYATTENKSCHGEGARYFFGEYINQNLAVTDAERDFGVFYRTTYGNLIKNGRSDVLTSGSWNKLTADQVVSQVTPSCEVFEQARNPDYYAYGRF